MDGITALEAAKAQHKDAIKDIQRTQNSLDGLCPCPDFPRAIAQGQISLLRGEVARCDRELHTLNDRRAVAISIGVGVAKWAAVAAVATGAAKLF